MARRLHHGRRRHKGIRLFERLEERTLLASFAVGDTPLSVALGDLNGDGVVDLVAGNQQAHDVSVLLGLGNGAFADQRRFAVGKSPESVTLGDVNGDGILDLATANLSFPGTVSLLLGVGDGTFADQRRFPAGERAFPFSLTMGDVNGDGFLDIVTANANYFTPTVSVLLGVGDGTFGAQRRFSTGPMGGPLGTTPFSVALGDVNGDGFLDIVTANAYSVDASVLLGVGDGTFAAPRQFATGDGEPSPGRPALGPSSVALGDVNGDGILDIVTASQLSAVSVLLGKGDGTFEAPRRLSVGNRPTSVTLGDVNADGALDIVTTNSWSHDVSVLLGLANGTFAPQQRFTVGDRPTSVTLGDVNGDGVLDLATANSHSHDVSVLFGVGDGTFTDTPLERPSVSLSADRTSIPEGGGVARITATLSQAHSRPVSIALSTSGSATQTADYTISDTQMIIAAGDTSGSITVTAVQDSVGEADETVIVDITAVTGGTESGVQRQTVTIIDDDEPPVPDVTLSVDNNMIAEAGGVAALAVTLSEVTTVPVTVNLAFTGTAAAGDYIASAVQIVVAPGATSGSITVTAVNDAEDEVDETVMVDIVSVTGGLKSGIQQRTVTIIDDDAPPMLTVAALTTTASGFTAHFATELETSGLNLHDTQALGLGPADVTLHGALSGPIPGSLVVDPARRRIVFVKTGGPLAPDTYTVTMRSAVDGFIDVGGQLLDGDNDGTAGDNYIGTFTVSAPVANAITIGIPDVVRGPGQSVNVPANVTTGIPVSISDGTNVRAIDLRVAYDPALLNITGATVGPGMPGGATVIVNTNTPGLAIVVFFSSTALPAGSSNFLHLQASVPAADSSGVYGKQQVLDVHAVTISDGNDNDFPVIVDDAVHLVSYFADVSGNGRINASDASQIARFAALIDRGFAGSLNTDPVIVGDVSGNGRVNAADASLLAQFAALIDVPVIPPIPAGILSAGVPSARPAWGVATPATAVRSRENSTSDGQDGGDDDSTFRVIEVFFSMVASADGLGASQIDAALSVDSETFSSLEDAIRELARSGTPRVGDRGNLGD